MADELEDDEEDEDELEDDFEVEEELEEEEVVFEEVVLEEEVFEDEVLLEVASFCEEDSAFEELSSLEVSCWEEKEGEVLEQDESNTESSVIIIWIRWFFLIGNSSQNPVYSMG